MAPASSSTDLISSRALAEPAPPRPYGAFVSYSRHTRTALLLTEELRLRGFATFRDFDSMQHGHRIESDIEEGLARADAVIFDVTEEALASEAVVEVEFKPTMRRARSGPPLALAVCRGLGSTPAEVHENTWARLTTPFDATWTMVLPGPTDPDVPIDTADAALAARRALAGVFRPGRGPEVGRWNIHVATHGHPSFGPELTVDATNLVGGNERRTGTPEDWSRIWRALCDLERVLAGHGTRRAITLTAYAHLTAAVAVGFAFRRTKGWDLCVEAGGRDDCQQSELLAHDDLTVSVDPGSLNGRVMVVEIDLLGHGIEPAVERALRGGQPPRARLLVRRRENHARIELSEFGAMAAATAHEIKRQQRRLGVTELRFFLAAPLPFAVLLGAELNAAGAQVQLHEFDGHNYHPSLTLDAR
jgi:SMODS-associated and fused to various effectors sensor domain/TIR domain